MGTAKQEARGEGSEGGGPAKPSLPWRPFLSTNHFISAGSRLKGKTSASWLWSTMTMAMGLQRAILQITGFTFRWSLVVRETKSVKKGIGFTTAHVLGPTADCFLYLLSQVLSPSSLTMTCAFAK